MLGDLITEGLNHKMPNTPPESSEMPLYKGNSTIEHPT